MSLRRIRDIERCSNTSDRVWLTFDDGGSPAQVRRILATLAGNRVKGRFFFTGAWAASNPALIRRISEDDGFGWPRRDGLKWPHLALVGVVVWMVADGAVGVVGAGRP